VPGRPQGGGGAGFVTVNNRLFAPLQGLNPDNVLMGGYGWLSWTDYDDYGNPHTLHCGLDLNSGQSCDDDLGALLVCPLAGVVRDCIYWNGTQPGEGNHIWIELDDGCDPGRASGVTTWLHNDHLDSFLVVPEQRLAPGEPYGRCGKSGGWSCAHGHVEWLKGPPQDGPWQWPYGWSRQQVEAAYWNPSEWWAAASALVLAEGGQPVPPEVVMILTDWQLRNWVMPDLWAWAGIPYNPESGTAQGWVEALRAGHYLGRPRTDERAYGEGDEAGVWVEFESGLLVYRISDGEASWTG
jgi:hypothetical protein